jgi:pyruvate/2-oxoacid:ferredoxin oxidoreductase alpha subunit
MGQGERSTTQRTYEAAVIRTRGIIVPAPSTGTAIEKSDSTKTETVLKANLARVATIRPVSVREARAVVGRIGSVNVFTVVASQDAASKGNITKAKQDNQGASKIDESEHPECAET